MSGFERRARHDRHEAPRGAVVEAPSPAPPGRRTLADAPAARASGKHTLTDLGAASAFPHRAAIEASFGRRVVATAHQGARAAETARALDAQAFAVGDRVAFASEPDLALAAHEAAHTLQHAALVHLFVGDGDPYEAHAAHVASLVARGESAAHLFGDAGRDATDVVRLAPNGESPARASAFSPDELLRQITPHGLRFEHGVAEGHVNASVAMQLLRTSGFAPRSLEDELGQLLARVPAAMLYVRVDVVNRTLDLSGTLQINHLVTKWFSGDVTIPHFALHAVTSHATVSIPMLAATDVIVFAQPLTIETLTIHGLELVANPQLFGLLATARLTDAHVHGVRYASEPPADLEIHDASLTLESLWTTFVARVGRIARALAHVDSAPPPEPERERPRGVHHLLDGGAEDRERPRQTKAVKEPEPERPFLPPDCRVAITINRVRAHAAEMRTKNADASALSVHVVLVRNGREVASIHLEGARLDAQDRLRGSIDRIAITGSRQLVHVLLQSPQVQVIDGLRLALEKLRDLGIDPAAGLDLRNVAIDELSNGVGARAELHATFALPAGSLEVSIPRVHVTAQSDARSAAVPHAALTLRDRGGREVAYLELGPSAVGGTTKSSDVAADVSFRGRGDTSALRRIVADLPALPPELRALIAQIPAHVGVTFAGHGHVEVNDAFGFVGDLDSTIAHGTGRITLAVHGLRIRHDDKQSAASFARLDARLLTATGRPVAAIAIFDARGTAAAGQHASVGRIAVTGGGPDVHELVDALVREPSLPAGVVDACRLAATYAGTTHASAVLSNVQLDVDRHGHARSRGNLNLELVVRDAGVLRLAATVAQRTNLLGAVGVEAPAVSGVLVDPAGKTIATFRAEAPELAVGTRVGMRAKLVSATGDARGLATLARALHEHVVGLPDPVRELLGLADGVEGADGTVMMELAALSATGDGVKLAGATVTGDVTVVDRDGTRYVGERVALHLADATVTTGETQTFAVGAITGAGRFVVDGLKRRRIAGELAIRTGRAVITLSGTHAEVRAEAIVVTGGGVVGPAPARDPDDHGTMSTAHLDVRAHNARHPELVQRFNTVTMDACVGNDGELDVEKVQAWQRAHHVEPDGRVTPAMVALAMGPVTDVAVAVAPTIVSGEIHVHTPLRPGTYRKMLNVLPGGGVDTDLVIRDNRIAPGSEFRLTGVAILGVGLNSQNRPDEPLVIKAPIKDDGELHILGPLLHYTADELGEKALDVRGFSLDLSATILRVCQVLADLDEREAHRAAQEDLAKDEQLAHDTSVWLERRARRGPGPEARREKTAAHDAAEQPRRIGLDAIVLAETFGNADVVLATGGRAAGAQGVVIGSGSTLRLHGESTGGAMLALSAKLDATASARLPTGMARGEVHASGGGRVAHAEPSNETRVELESFRVDSVQLRWEGETKPEP